MLRERFSITEPLTVLWYPAGDYLGAIAIFNLYK
jgi:hypothetical protein